MILRDGFFEDIQAVRRGIVISEILGKPRGLQGLDAWGDIG